MHNGQGSITATFLWSDFNSIYLVSLRIHLGQDSVAAGVNQIVPKNRTANISSVLYNLNFVITPQMNFGSTAMDKALSSILVSFQGTPQDLSCVLWELFMRTHRGAFSSLKLLL